MVNLFAKQINPDRILALQNKQYSEKLFLEDVVGAGVSKLGKVNISSLGHFYCIYITGHFNRLRFDDPDIVDTGVNYLRAKMSDGSNQRQLFNDYIPLDLFLTPGGVKDNAATNLLTTADPSNNLFYPQPFQYLFTVNSEILFDVKNDGNKDMSYGLVFHGIRFPVAQSRRR